MSFNDFFLIYFTGKIPHMCDMAFNEPIHYYQANTALILCSYRLVLTDSSGFFTHRYHG